MRKTRILEPMDCKNDTTKKNAKLIFDTLEHAKFNDTDTFDSFLETLGLTEDEYINAIQCSLN